MEYLLTLIIVIGLSYFVYIDSQKRGVKQEYIWVLSTFFLPIIGLIIYLLKRPKKIIKDKFEYKPYGFRSKTPWKIAFASIVYLFIFVAVVSAAGSPQTDNNKNTLNSSKSEAAVADKKDNNNKSEKKAEPANEIKTTNTAETAVANGHKLRVHYIDVGQADCILVQIPNGKNLLIDAGNNADSGTVVSYLQNQGVQRLDIVIGTHPHEDHIGSMDTVINTFEIGQFVMPKANSTSQTYKDVITTISNKGLKITEAKAGLNLNLGGEIIAQLIAPNSSSYEDLNNYSAVLKLTFGKTTFLFDGDAEDVSENEIQSSGVNVKADVLKVGHHGSNSSTTTSFLSKVSPKYAVISVGKGNSYGHPTLTTLDKLNNAGAKIFRTDEQGTIVAESDGTNITFNTIATSIQPRAPDQAVSQPTPATVAPAPAVTPSNGDVTVFVTNTGSKYHRDGCRYLSKSKIPISLSNAKSQGYGPCSVCNPPQ